MRLVDGKRYVPKNWPGVKYIEMFKSQNYTNTFDAYVYPDAEACPTEVQYVRTRLYHADGRSWDQMKALGVDFDIKEEYKGVI